VTGRNRTINRQKFELAALKTELADPASLRSLVFQRYARLLRARGTSSAFDPHGRQQVLDCSNEIFALLRISPDGSQRVLCLHNVSTQSQNIRTDLNDIFSSVPLTDLTTGRPIDEATGSLFLQPYQILWLTPRHDL